MDALVPASTVNMETITACAAKGEILPVCYTEGGVHPDLALFLGSPVFPEEDEFPTLMLNFDVGNISTSVEGHEADGFVVVGNGPDNITVRLRPGFRIILFSTSLEFARPRLPPRQPQSCGRHSSSLVFLEDVPEALAGVQVIRFGGVDCVGDSANDSPPNESDRSSPVGSERGGGSIAPSRKNNAVSPSLSSGSDSSSSTSSEESNEHNDECLPRFVLAAMGRIRRPGCEASSTWEARLQKEMVTTHPSAISGSELDQATIALGRARREALTYSNQLNSTHEAVVALLTARPSCFRPLPPSRSRAADTLPGGEPSSGVSDDIEGDQNRVLNNLIETVSAYKATLEKGPEVVLRCTRAPQAAHSKAMRLAGRGTQRLVSVTTTFLKYSGDMLHACGSDPVMYSPVFPGVRTLVYSAIRQAADARRKEICLDEGHEKDSEVHLMLNTLTKTLATRLPAKLTWTLPLAATAAHSHDNFPARGWWDTCLVMLADRHETERNTASQLDLAHLISMISRGARGKGITLPNVKAKLMATFRSKVDGAHQNEKDVAQGDRAATAHEIAQICAIVDVWLTYDAGGDEVAKIDEDADDGRSEDETNKSYDLSGKTVSPHHWDLGFDTSDWGRPQQAPAAAEHSADGPAEFVDGKEAHAFFERLSHLWAAAKIDRSKLSHHQATAAEYFCQDQVLRRLVLLESTMNGVFARLPRYVMCEPVKWLHWMAIIRSTLTATQECGDIRSVDRLHFLLCKPPPTVLAATPGEGQEDETLNQTDTDTKASPSSSSDEGDDTSGMMNNGTTLNSEKDVAFRQSPSSSALLGKPGIHRDASSPSKSAGEADAALNKAAPGAGRRVRRDSRERMKIKLGIANGVETVAGEETSKEVSATAQKEFLARASALFGVSSSLTAARTGMVSVGSAATIADTAARAVVLSNKEKSRTAGRNLASGLTHEEDAADDEDKYITFVAETFRPERDNTDWHREVRSPRPLPKADKKPVDLPPSAIVDQKTSTMGAVPKGEIPTTASSAGTEGTQTASEAQSTTNEEADKKNSACSPEGNTSPKMLSKEKDCNNPIEDRGETSTDDTAASDLHSHMSRNKVDRQSARYIVLP